MIFHENRLLADDSHVVSYLIFVNKLGKTLQKVSSAAVVIGALRDKIRVPVAQFCTLRFYYCGHVDLAVEHAQQHIYINYEGCSIISPLCLLTIWL